MGIFHEVNTNALKYSALVSACWSVILHIESNLLVGISLCVWQHGQQSFGSIFLGVAAARYSWAESGFFLVCRGMRDGQERIRIKKAGGGREKICRW